MFKLLRKTRPSCTSGCKWKGAPTACLRVEGVGRCFPWADASEPALPAQNQSLSAHGFTPARTQGGLQQSPRRTGIKQNK